MVQHKQHRISVKNRSGVPGVCFSKARNMWKATHGGTYLGVFKEFEAAVNAKQEYIQNGRQFAPRPQTEDLVGIWWIAHLKKWAAATSIYLGHFGTIEEAVKAQSCHYSTHG